MLDAFLTLMVPYLKTGVRSEYSVQARIKQKPSVICDLEIKIGGGPTASGGQAQVNTAVVLHRE